MRQNLGDLLKLVCTFGLLFVSASLHATVIFSNGAEAGLSGVGLATEARPGGGFYSRISAGLNFIGYTCDGNFYLADNFSVRGIGAEITSITVFAQQQFANVPTIVGGTCQIRLGGPAGALVASGTFQSCHFTDTYRVSQNVTNDDYRIQAVKFDFGGTELAPGNYFLVYTLDNGFGAGPYSPSLARVGSPTTPNANAQQYNWLTQSWGPIPEPSPQDLPFTIEGKQCADIMLSYDTVAGQLDSVSPFSGASDPYATLPTPAILGSTTYDPTKQRLFGVTSTTNKLYEFELDGTLKLTGDIGTQPLTIHGLEWDDQFEELLAVTSPQSVANPAVLLKINANNANVTFAIPLPLFGGVNDIAFNSRTNTLYMFNSSNLTLYEVNRTFGNLTTVGVVGGPTSPGDLAYSRDLDMLFLVESNGNLWRINMGTGGAVRIGDIGGGNYLGLACINEDRAVPESLVVDQGLLFGGGVQQLRVSDDDRFYVLNDADHPNTRLIVTTDHCISAVTRLHFSIESFCTTNDLTEFIEFRDWTSNAYVPVGARSTTRTETFKSYHLSSNVNRFMSAQRAVEARLRYIPQADLEAADGWAIGIDLIRIDVAP